jgi:hypothetical protein
MNPELASTVAFLRKLWKLDGTQRTGSDTHLLAGINSTDTKHLFEYVMSRAS